MLIVCVQKPGVVLLAKEMCVLEMRYLNRTLADDNTRPQTPGENTQNMKFGVLTVDRHYERLRSHEISADWNAFERLN